MRKEGEGDRVWKHETDDGDVSHAWYEDGMIKVGCSGSRPLWGSEWGGIGEHFKIEEKDY